VLIQAVQRAIHARIITAAMKEDFDHPAEPPLPVRVISKLPALGAIAGYFVAIGPLPEHAPAFARR
jgi:hypothetical protein